ncbi:MAG: ATP synthase F1 subunit gamma [Deltaproteobacteria bacterium]|nr:ATP synthase F1 subunit gamma [Deltaproteobacteria bacterium]
MASLRDIQKRIVTVKNTQKITKAMKMVAAAKLRRAQMAVIGARPYTDKLSEIIKELLSRSTDSTNPFFTPKTKINNVQVMTFTSNRGLCGGFNSNLLRRTDAFLTELKGKSIAHDLTMVGKKGRDFCKARKINVNESLIDEADTLSFERAGVIAGVVIEKFLSGQIDEFYLVFNRFVSVITQEITVKRVLPLASERETSAYPGMDYIYEPGRDEILSSLVPKYLANEIYRAHLESRASELGSRMSAMENATNNAKEMIGSLTLKYNRARQAAITVELMDIVNGAEAIK